MITTVTANEIERVIHKLRHATTHQSIADAISLLELMLAMARSGEV